jgi:hypothetical protein
MDRKIKKPVNLTGADKINVYCPIGKRFIDMKMGDEITFTINNKTEYGLDEGWETITLRGHINGLGWSGGQAPENVTSIDMKIDKQRKNYNSFNN